MNFYLEIFVFVMVTLIIYSYFFSKEKERLRVYYANIKPENRRRLNRLCNQSSVRAFIMDERLITCWVLDKTIEGIAILVGDNEFPLNKMVIGNIISIKTTKSDMNWTEIEVRNFTKEAGGWKIGCKFVQPISEQFLIDFSA